MFTQRTREAAAVAAAVRVAQRENVSSIRHRMQPTATEKSPQPTTTHDHHHIPSQALLRTASSSQPTNQPPRFQNNGCMVHHQTHHNPATPNTPTLCPLVVQQQQQHSLVSLCVVPCVSVAAGVRTNCIRALLLPRPETFFLLVFPSSTLQQDLSEHDNRAAA